MLCEGPGGAFQPSPVPVRHPEIVTVGRHYGMTVHTCVPYDPETKGGSEATVRIAKADLVPAEANLLEGYGSFAGLARACEQSCEVVNGRVHRLQVERSRLHPVPDAPHTAALGTTRVVNTDQTIRFGSVRHLGLGRVRHCGRTGTGTVNRREAAGLIETLTDVDEFLRTPGTAALLEAFYRDRRGGVRPGCDASLLIDSVGLTGAVRCAACATIPA